MPLLSIFSEPLVRVEFVPDTEGFRKERVREGIFDMLTLLTMRVNKTRLRIGQTRPGEGGRRIWTHYLGQFSEFRRFNLVTKPYDDP